MKEINSPRIVTRKTSHQGFLSSNDDEERITRDRKTFIHSYLKKFEPEPSLKSQILDYFKEIKLTRKKSKKK